MENTEDRGTAYTGDTIFGAYMLTNPGSRSETVELENNQLCSVFWLGGRRASEMNVFPS